MNGTLSKKIDRTTKPNPPAPATGNRLKPITLSGLGPGSALCSCVTTVTPVSRHKPDLQEKQHA